MNLERLIAVDWGTSSLRAWRFDASGALVAAYRADEGILTVPLGGFPDILRAAIGGWLQGDSIVLMCGMVGSRQGWVEAPYVATPCGVEELSSQLKRLPFDPPCYVVPGVIRHGAAPDVMRGEEAKFAGLAKDARPAGLSGLAVLPGTHSKWVWHVHGQITWFRTFMTGELFELLGHHSLIGRSMESEHIDPAGFEWGLAQARAPGGLPEKLFGLRASWLSGALPAEQLRGGLSGLLLGTELHDALAALEREVGPVASSLGRVDLVASPALTQVYSTLLRGAGVDIRAVGEEIAALGLQQIAIKAGLLS